MRVGSIRGNRGAVFRSAPELALLISAIDWIRELNVAVVCAVRLHQTCLDCAYR